MCDNTVCSLNLWKIKMGKNKMKIVVLQRYQIVTNLQYRMTLNCCALSHLRSWNYLLVLVYCVNSQLIFITLYPSKRLIFRLSLYEVFITQISGGVLNVCRGLISPLGGRRILTHINKKCEYKGFKVPIHTTSGKMLVFKISL